MSLIRQGFVGMHLWVVAPSDTEQEEVSSFNPVEWADSEPDATSETHALSEPEEDPDGFLVTMRSSSDREAVTVPEATFRGTLSDSCN